MHYYNFNIRDYASYTRHLTEFEDIAYRRMLDYCYSKEVGLPPSVGEVASLIRMQSHIDSVEIVLREFFFQQPDGSWHNRRVDREIAEFKNGGSKRHWAANLSKEVRCAFAAKRRAMKANALPKWLTPSHHQEMRDIYAKSREISKDSGIKHEVDHIVPLLAEKACGLHVPWNLQIIPAYKNRLKSNSLEEC